MEMRFIQKDKNLIEFECEKADHSILQLLAEKLNNQDGVEFAAYKIEHPMLKKPKFIIKTKKKEASAFLLEALKSIQQDFEEFRKKVADTMA